MDALRDTRRSGFTLAPEAATEKMRDIINKYVQDAQVLETAHEIYKRGWRTIKVKLVGENTKKFHVRTRSGYRPRPAHDTGTAPNP